MARNNGSSMRGFAVMDGEKQRAIARKGGEAVSRDRKHMAEIGRKGGEARARSASVGSSGAHVSGDGRDNSTGRVG